MKRLLILILLFISIDTIAQDQSDRIVDKEVKNGSYLGYRYVHVIPSNLHDCLLALSCNSPEILKHFGESELEKALTKGLFNANNRLRMNWKLQLPSSPLTQYFYKQKVYHPTTMETIILWVLHNDMNDEKIKINRIIRKSKRRHRHLERMERKRLRKIYKSQKEYLKNPPENNSKTEGKSRPPLTFEEWIYTY